MFSVFYLVVRFIWTILHRFKLGAIVVDILNVDIQHHAHASIPARAPHNARGQRKGIRTAALEVESPFRIAKRNLPAGRVNSECVGVI